MKIILFFSIIINVFGIQPNFKNYLEQKFKLQNSMEICDIEKIETCGEVCETCSGSGELLCRFCKGTTFLTLGDELIGTNNKCPICNNDGYEICKKCGGSGNIAFWINKK